mgnify:FL=1
MRKAINSIQVRAKMILLEEALEDYLARLKFHRRFKKLEKRVHEYEEKCGRKRIKMVNNNMIASPRLNEVVQTRTG